MASAPFRALLLALACLTGSLSAQAARHDGPRDVPFGGWIELDALGKPKTFELADEARVPEVLQGPLRAQVAALRFEPASTVDGRAVAARSWLQGDLRLTPDGDEFLLSLVDARLGPRPKDVQPVAFRAGRTPVAVLAEFTVAADGSTKDIRVTTLGSPDAEAEAAVHASVENSRFDPESIDGAASETRMFQPLVIRRTRDPELVPELPVRDWPTGRPRANGQAAYEPVATVLRVRRRGANAPLESPSEPARPREQEDR